ncbi:hypothetical protein GDV60_07910 [Pseudomonas sp. DTU12.1]|nr:hypothetical protein GDV60_07910 [Pseudomonas sp. DTU12.1]
MLRGPAAIGHPWPCRGYPGILPGCPLRNTCLRPSWFNGAPKIKSQIKSRATATTKPERAAAFPCGSWLACDSGVSADKYID